MASSSSFTFSVSLDSLDIAQEQHVLGMPVQTYVDESSFLLGPTVVSIISFITGAQTLMSNIIYKGSAGALNVTTLTASDVAGTGDINIYPATGRTVHIDSVRIGLSNQTNSFAVPIEKSGYVWTNTGASTMTATLPSGAPNGTSAAFIRTGGALTISPTAVGQIFATASGVFRALGATIILASSGAKTILVSNGAEGWYPLIEEGTITQG